MQSICSCVLSWSVSCGSSWRWCLLAMMVLVPWHTWNQVASARVDCTDTRGLLRRLSGCCPCIMTAHALASCLLLSGGLEHATHHALPCPAASLAPRAGLAGSP
jgi:hypothetical protein